MVKETMEALIAEATAKVEQLTNLLAEIEAEKKAAFDAGYVEGAASVGSNVVYTEEELQAKIVEAVAPLNVQISDLNLQLATVPEQIAAAITAKVTELAAAYEAQQVAETASETGFKDLLK